MRSEVFSEMRFNSKFTSLSVFSLALSGGVFAALSRVSRSSKFNYEMKNRQVAMNEIRQGLTVNA